MDVLIILPTYNEEENISTMIDSIRAVSRKWRILVVDGGSKDRTVEIAKMMGAGVFIFPARGKGKGIAAALKTVDADRIVLLDADLSYPPTEIPKLLKKLDECDAVVGSRFLGRIENGAMGKINRFGNWFLTSLGNLLYGSSITDLCSGLWAFKKDFYKSMEITAPHFELEANFFTECMKKKCKLCEVPIEYKKRGGKTKLSIYDGVKIGLFLLSEKISKKASL